MRKRLIQVLAIVALALGLLLGTGVVSQADRSGNLATPYALMGGGSGG